MLALGLVSPRYLFRFQPRWPRPGGIFPGCDTPGRNAKRRHESPLPSGLKFLSLGPLSQTTCFFPFRAQ